MELYWNAIFAAVPPDLILDEEIVASLLEHKDLLLQCLERAGNRYYLPVNTYTFI